MTEFIDPEGIVTTFIILISISILMSILNLSLENTPLITIPKYTKYIFLVTLSLPVVVAIYNQDLALEHIKLINAGQSLKCKVNNSLMLVSKKNNWSIEGMYFFRDPVLIRADNCKRD